MKFAVVIILVISRVAIGFAQPVQDLKFWLERITQTQVGMRREEVERILPPYIPPQGGGFTDRSQGITYAVAPGYTVVVCYDYTGIPRDADGKVLRHYSPDNRLLESVKLRPIAATELQQVMLTELAAALATNDAGLIGAARMEIEMIIPRAHIEKASRAMRDAKFQLMLAALQKVDAADDKSFDPNDVPMANMAPPQGKDCTLYDSGISPDSIKDADVRFEYKLMLAANSAKAARYNRRRVLYNARWDWIRVVEEFRRDQYDGGVDDTNTISQLVAAEIKNAALKKEVTELLAAKK